MGFIGSFIIGLLVAAVLKALFGEPEEDKKTGADAQ